MCIALLSLTQNSGGRTGLHRGTAHQRGSGVVPPASPGGALGPQGGTAAWPTAQQCLSGAGARKAPSTERSPTGRSQQHRGNCSKDKKATDGWESLQTTHQPKGVSLQYTQELLQITSKKPNNPIPDGLKMSTDVSPGQVLSLPDHQGDAGQTTGHGHVTPVQRRELQGPSGQEPALQGRGGGFGPRSGN